tara:strand:+ start:410 stop:1123 length:714 start_codon:yes stop_codon:yes gene_type:complete
MWDIVYYLAGVGMIGTIGYGVLWIYDRDMAEDVAQQVSWNSVKAYHKANLEYNNLKRWYEVNTRERLDRSDDEADAELDEIVQKDIEFLGYNESDDTTFTSDEIEDNEYIQENNFDLMFLIKKGENNKLYKRILDKNEISEDIKMEKTVKPFIQIELCQNENKTSIHKHLENFYIEDNKILDKTFMKWYVKTFYSVLLDEDYTLSIIDSDVNMLKINKDQHVILTQNKKYTLETDKE